MPRSNPVRRPAPASPVCTAGLAPARILGLSNHRHVVLSPPIDPPLLARHRRRLLDLERHARHRRLVQLHLDGGRADDAAPSELNKTGQITTPKARLSNNCRYGEASGSWMNVSLRKPAYRSTQVHAGSVTLVTRTVPGGCGTGAGRLPDKGQEIVAIRRHDTLEHLLLGGKHRAGLTGQALLLQPMSVTFP